MEKKDIIKSIKNYPNDRTFKLRYVSLKDSESIIETGQELLTDGEIDNISYSYEEEYFKGEYSTEMKTFKKGSSVLNIKNANYVIIQKLRDKEIDYVEIFTNLENDDLDQVIEMSSRKYDGEDNLLNKREPYVRKISLK